MEKKEQKKKSDRFALPAPGKESTFQERLWYLVGDRSVRQVCKEWDMPYSTINNYLTKGTEPALKVAHKISKYEKVSLSWLATGDADEEISTNETEIRQAPVDELRRDWMRIFDHMTKQERVNIINHITRNGIRSIIPDGMDNGSPANLDDSELIEIEENLLSHGINRTAAKVIMMALNLPTDEVREIFEAAATSARLKSSQGSVTRGQEKKA